MTLSFLNNSAAPIATGVIGMSFARAKKRFRILLSNRQRAAVRRQLCALTPAQLRDAGIDPSGIATGPVFEIEARTITDLMSMR